jgi:hypothetical protein
MLQYRVLEAKELSGPDRGRFFPPSFYTTAI